MLNDLYCEYYPHYRNNIVQDTDQCFRVLKYWNGRWKPDHYTKRWPRDIDYFTGYNMRTVSDLKQINAYAKERKHQALQRRIEGKRSPIRHVKPFWARIKTKERKAHRLNNPKEVFFKM